MSKSVKTIFNTLFITLLFYSNTVLASKDSFEQNKLLILAEIHGLVKYYQPGTETDQLNWDQHFINNYKTILNASDEISFNKAIREWLAPLDIKNRSNEKYESGNDYLNLPKSTYPIKPDFSWIENDFIDKANSNDLASILNNYKPFKRKSVNDKKYGIEHLNSFNGLVGDSTAIYALGIITFWNKVQFFYPYKDLMDSSWDSALLDLSNEFVELKKHDNYINTLKLLCSKLNDSHAHITEDKYNTWYYGTFNCAAFPIKIKSVNNISYVSWVSDSISHLINIGDTVFAIDNTPIQNVLDSIKNTISCSTVGNCANRADAIVIKAITHPDLGKENVKITINNNEYLLKRSVTNILDYNRLGSVDGGIKNYNPEVGYIDLTKSDKKQLNKSFKKFKECNTLILDLRGYPPSSAIQVLAKNLSKKSAKVASIYYPSYDYPGVFNDYQKSIKYYISNLFDYFIFALSPGKGKIFPSFKRPFEGRIYVLINEEAISYAETIGMLIKSYRPNSIFVGRQSTGANGNVVRIPLPFGVSATFTGLNWHYANGDQFQRIGIIPDVTVPLSYQEAILKSDVVLNEALKYANDN